MMAAEQLSKVGLYPSKDLMVVVSMQSFCLPARSTLTYVRELSKQHGFRLTEVNHDGEMSPDLAGKIIPRISVYAKKEEKKILEPLTGAQTKKAITAYLREAGVIQNELHV